MGPYEKKLNEVVAITNSLEGTSGSRAPKAIIKDLSGHGQISELLYTLDRQNFDKVIELLVEFRDRGRAKCLNVPSNARASSFPDLFFRSCCSFSAVRTDLGRQNASTPASFR
jgi:hypothetical protein